MHWCDRQQRAGLPSCYHVLQEYWFGQSLRYGPPLFRCVRLSLCAQWSQRGFLSYLYGWFQSSLHDWPRG